MIINKKVWPEYFGKLLTGEKKFELRLADFDIKEGDTLVLEEYDPKKMYTGRKIEKTCKSVLKINPLSFPHSLEDIKKYGFYVIGL